MSRSQWQPNHLRNTLQFIKKHIFDTVKQHSVYSTKLHINECATNYYLLSMEEKHQFGDRAWSAINSKWSKIQHNFQPPHYEKLKKSKDSQIEEWCRILCIHGINDIDPNNKWSIDDFKEYIKFKGYVESFENHQFHSSPLVSSEMINFINLKQLKISLQQKKNAIFSQLLYLDTYDIVSVLKAAYSVKCDIFKKYLFELRERVTIAADTESAIDTLDDTAILIMFDVFNKCGKNMQEIVFYLMETYLMYNTNEMIVEQFINLLDDDKCIAIDINQILHLLKYEEPEWLIKYGLMDKLDKYIDSLSSDELLSNCSKLLQTACKSKHSSPNDYKTMLKNICFFMSYYDETLISESISSYISLLNSYLNDEIQSNELDLIERIFVAQFVETKNENIKENISKKQQYDKRILDEFMRENESKLPIGDFYAHGIPEVINGVTMLYYDTNWSGRPAKRQKINIFERLCELLTLKLSNHFMSDLLKLLEMVLTAAAKAAKSKQILHEIARKCLDNHIMYILNKLCLCHQYKKHRQRFIFVLAVIVQSAEIADVKKHDLGTKYMNIIERTFSDKNNIIIGKTEEAECIIFTLLTIQKIYNHSNQFMLNFLNQILSASINETTKDFVRILKDQFADK